MGMFSSAALRGRQFLAVDAIRVIMDALMGLLLIAPANAQQASDDDESIEEITVLGSRAIIQSTIDIRRNATTIVDGLSAAEIGDLPALSIGEALESIAGAASHRENGGATEISIRGLGALSQRDDVQRSYGNQRHR